MTVAEIAKVCHEANKAYCETLGDTSQLPWGLAPEWQKESAMKGVEFRMNDPLATGEDMHQSWMDQKLADGWRYGAVKDAEKKTHPCVLPYANLPLEQKLKDVLFSAVVQALTWEDEE